MEDYGSLNLQIIIIIFVRDHQTTAEKGSYLWISILHSMQADSENILFVLGFLTFVALMALSSVATLIVTMIFPYPSLW